MPGGGAAPEKFGLPDWPLPPGMTIDIKVQVAEATCKGCPTPSDSFRNTAESWLMQNKPSAD